MRLTRSWNVVSTKLKMGRKLENEKMTKKVKKELKTSLVKIRIVMKTNGENGLKVEGENKLK